MGFLQFGSYAGRVMRVGVIGFVESRRVFYLLYSLTVLEQRGLQACQYVRGVGGGLYRLLVFTNVHVVACGVARRDFQR